MSTSERSHDYGVTLAVACIATAMLILDISIINTALSRIATGLHTGLGGLQWIFDGYTLPLAAVVLTAGALADRFGRKRVFMTGLALFCAASATCGASRSIGLLDAARAVQGIGAAMLFATSLALIAHVTPRPADRAKGMAMYGMTIGVALALGPLVGGLLTEGISWRAIFLINVPLGAIGLALTAKRVSESRDPITRRIDWPGQATLIAGLFGLVLGLLRANADGWTSTLVLISLGAGAACLAVFTVIELVSDEPMLPLRLFRLPNFAGVQLSVFAISASAFAIYLYLSLYLQDVLGRSPLQTGLAYLPGSILMFLISGATPRLGSRIGNGALATIGMALATGGCLLTLLAGAHSSWTITLPGTMTALFGVGMYNPAISVIAVSALPETQSGLASGAYDTFRQSGLALGTAALGAFVSAGSLAGHNVSDYVSGFHHLALLAGGIGTAGTLITGVLLMRSRRTTATVVVPLRGTDMPALEPAVAVATEE
jgi:EmrB/QacA subfamily drug resistance transporter